MNSAFSRPNWAVINLENLRHNARVLALHAAPAKILAVIKAGAYGHGAYHVSHALQNEECVQFFGVASVDEGQQLRGLGIEKPILLLSAILPDEVADAVAHDLSPTIFSVEIARRVSLESARQNKTTRAHFKVNTGMNRLGAHFSEAARVFDEIRALPNLEIEGVYTHMACADDENDELTPSQLARFQEFLPEIGAGNLVKHAANSATTLRYKDAHFDLVRPGIALYGAHPCPDCAAPSLDLRPVMTWKSRVTAIQNVRAGEGVSYGSVWRATQNTRVAVVACGYADGYPRSLSGANTSGTGENRGGEILLRGARFPVVGRVTMDQILVNIGAAPCEIGDEVTLWGQGLPVEEVAARAGTISYELLCSVSSRVPRVVIGS